ncbi:GNAT family N-acetyltransferase [Clostridium sp. UBA6640]|uniref:GNAT family N-acetyltransferase n=1 Tax=Clostridium sp. UBA6640 TaxID=1946370 RepID=UPI0025BA5245|nr:GNAT family N-acetyltransferase [Clostridium sp. UBA6640]
MINFKKLNSVKDILPLRKQYYNSLLRSMEDYHDIVHIITASYFGVYSNDVLIGYYSISNNNNLLSQFYIIDEYKTLNEKVFSMIIEEKSIEGAIVCSIEPIFLSLAMGVAKEISIDSYLFYDFNLNGLMKKYDSLNFILAKGEQIEKIKVFYMKNLEEKDESIDSYLLGLVANDELFVLCDGNEILGVGEYRKSNIFPGTVNLGIVVNKSYRNRGYGSYIMYKLLEKSITRGHKAICSCDFDNIASNKALVKAGFISRHKVFKVIF